MNSGTTNDKRIMYTRESRPALQSDRDLQHNRNPENLSIGQIWERGRKAGFSEGYNAAVSAGSLINKPDTKHKRTIR